MQQNIIFPSEEFSNNILTETNLNLLELLQEFKTNTIVQMSREFSTAISKYYDNVRFFASYLAEDQEHICVWEHKLGFINLLSDQTFALSNAMNYAEGKGSALELSILANLFALSNMLVDDQENPYSDFFYFLYYYIEEIANLNKDLISKKMLVKFLG